MPGKFTLSSNYNPGNPPGLVYQYRKSARLIRVQEIVRPLPPPPNQTVRSERWLVTIGNNGFLHQETAGAVLALGRIPASSS